LVSGECRIGIAQTDFTGEQDFNLEEKSSCYSTGRSQYRFGSEEGKMSAFRILLLACLTLGSHGVSAQVANYPVRPVKVISDSAPGSAVDVATRIIADRLGRLWGMQVVVANHPGAGGALSASVAASAAPDGYTIYMPALSVFLAVPGRAPNLPLRLPRDFAAIGSISDQPMFIAVAPSLGVSTLPELIALAKKRPGEISYAATGIGRLSHLTGELLQDRTGIKLLVVPYSSGGTSQALVDIMGGRIPIVIEAYQGLAGAVQSGTIKPIATATSKRLPDFPDLPTVAETLPGFEAVGWQAVLAPVGTPEAIIIKVNADLRRVLDDPGVKKQFAVNGAYVRPMAPAEVVTFVNNQQQMWLPILQRLAQPQN
jgi:tripartite-type tricarboxylate transporter receptor subunit TctC